MLFPAANIGALQFRLLLIRPDFQPDQGRSIEVLHRLDTDISEGRTTIEERRPGRRAMLLSQTCTLCLQGNAADDWRKGLAALGPRPVGMPLWIDALAPAQWGERIYDALKIVGFNPDSGAFTIYDGPNLPGVINYPLYAPLLIGRWPKRPPAKPRTSNFGYVPLTLNEGSPWTCRIGPHTQAGGWTAWPDLEQDSEDASDYGLELIQNSAAREPALDRANAAPRWTQSSRFTFPNRLSIRQHLSHFAAMGGALTSWSPLPAWFQPGADTAGTPSNYTARFAADTFNLSFVAGHVARSNVGFVQEIDTPTRPQQLPGEFFLYKWEYQHELGNPELCTNCDEPMVLPEGTYEPRQVGHQELRPSLKAQEDKATITLDYRAGSLADDWLRGRLFGWVRLTVWKCDPNNPAGTRGAPAYAGFVNNVRPDGNQLTVEASLFGRLLKERAPGDVFGPSCNTWVFSPRCTLDEVAHRSAGTAATADLSADGKTLTVHAPNGWGDHGAGTYDDNWFAKGLLRTGVNRFRIIVSIVASEMSGANLVLKLARPLWPDMLSGGAGQTVQLVPGCGRQPVSDCTTKFNNHDNFQGHEFMPKFIEQRDAGSPKGPKK
jgi:hypothetical protein